MHFQPQLSDLVRLDEKVTEGATVEARWTNCHCFYRARAVVVKLNRKSMRVSLVDAVPSQIGGGPYPADHVIVLPRSGAPTWSANNCAAPAPEIKKP